MGQLWGFGVYCPLQELEVPGSDILLEYGMNHFNVLVDDPQVLKAFLEERGMTVKAMVAHAVTHNTAPLAPLILPTTEQPDSLPTEVPSTPEES